MFVRAMLVMIALCSSLEAQDTAIETVAVSDKAILQETVLEGIVEPISRATVSAQTSGQVTEVNYDVNDYVTKDSVIVRLREMRQSSQVAQAEAEVRAAKARHLEAGKSYKRAQDLYAKKSISKADFDASKSAFDSSKAQMEAAQAAVNQAQELLGYTVVRAPFDGVVTARHIEIGETVSPGQPLMTGFSLNRLRIRVDVPQRLIGPITEMKTARVLAQNQSSISVPDDSITIFPYANEQSNTVTIRINLPDETANLFPGMLVKVGFATGQSSTLVVPESAIVRRSEVTGVYVVGDAGDIQLRQLRVGKPAGEGTIQVLAGLVAGEQVAVNPILAGIALNNPTNESQ